MQIISSAFPYNEKMPAKYTCDGQNISPPLQFVKVPDNAITLALILTDPDAPSGFFAHWLMWNIDPATIELSEGFCPAEAVQGTNDFGKVGYGGPCPPSGTHRYVFRLYALSQVLNLPETARRDDLEIAIQGKIINSCDLIGLYTRQR